MGTQKFSIKTHFDLVHKVPFFEFVYTTMFNFAHFSWVLINSHMINLFGLLIRYLFRNYENCLTKGLILSTIDEDEIDTNISGDFKFGDFGKEENSEFHFKFEFLRNEDFDKRIEEETESSVSMEPQLTPITSKYEFVSEKLRSGFIAEPKTMSFTVQELFLGSDEDFSVNKGQNLDFGVCLGTDFQNLNAEAKTQVLQVGSTNASSDNNTDTEKSFEELYVKTDSFDQEKAEDSVKSTLEKVVFEKQEQVAGSTGDDLCENKDYDNLCDGSSLGDQKIDFPMPCFEEIGFIDGESLIRREKTEDSVKKHAFEKVILEKQEQVVGSIEYELYENTDYDNLSDGSSLEDLKIASTMPCLEEISFFDGEPLIRRGKAEDSVKRTFEKVILEKQEQAVSCTEDQLHENEDYDNLSNGSSLEDQKIDSTMPCLEEIGYLNGESLIRRENTEDSDDEYIELNPKLHNSSEFKDGLVKSEEPISRNLFDSDSDEEDDFAVLEEHEDLIEQIRMELKNSRTGGLPTILEECETPRVLDDLRPLKLEEKLMDHKDRLDEIQKVHKSYAEKMRKLDVLNYQTMHAISLLQLKDSFQQTSNRNKSFSAIRSLVFPNLWPCKLRRVYADPTLKSITELHRDLEMVYVGQVCLSWEILHWQYKKAQELLEHDSQGHRPYNQVAVEFQQFQVLLERFVENELYKGPRVQNYAQNRCLLRTLLQIPAIKEDHLKDKLERIRLEGKDVLPIAMLTEIIEESMHVFWDFLQADKYETNMILKVVQGTHVRNQESIDSELMMDIKTSLQKKEKKLKDIVRSGNCIVKKFQKPQEGRMDLSTLVAQVELRLVSRVLNFSRLRTDQLVWCQMKLDKIKFVSRRIHVEEEPSFLLFPF